MKRFVPLVLLTVAGFTFNTSELTPIGLLTDIAADFHTSEAHAGLLISIYAWIVALCSLPLMLWCARMDFRRLLLGIVALFFVSHIGSVLSTGFWGLMASRVGVALAHSIFWSIAPTMAVAVSPDGRRSTALSALVAGGGIALVAGLPLGRVLGLLAGWRATLGALGLLSFLTLVGLYFYFPSMGRSGEGESRKDMLRDILTCRPLLCIYFITAVIVTGHYTGYSYIEPFMDSILHIEAKAITFTLCLFGVAGLLGSFLMTRYFPRHPRGIISTACLSLPILMLLLYPGAQLGLVVLALICVLWGLSLTVYNIAFQNEIIVLAPHNSAVAMSIYSGIFNLGIGAGAFVGGIVCNHDMMADIGYVGGTIALAAALFALFVYLPVRKSGPTA